MTSKSFFMSIFANVEYINSNYMTNLYWPIYKKIEKEIVELSNHIHFDDNQLSVYSVKIVELLIRCVVEIEAISKDLYLKNGGAIPAGRVLYYDTDCLNLLEGIWELSKKQVIVSSANFYFQDNNNKILYPLRKANKRSTSGADWAKAYQAVKHNRSLNLSKGNIKHLLRASAALFLLNLYYRDDVFELSSNNTNTFTEKFSEIFDVKVHTWAGDSTGADSYVKKPDFEECVYLIKWANDYKNKFTEWASEQGRKLNEIIFSHPKVNQYINENLIEDGKIKEKEFASFIENRDYFKCFDTKKEYGSMIQSAGRHASEKLKFDFKRTPAQFEAVLNKNQKIYQNG